MKKVFRKCIAIICVLSIAITPCVCFAEDSILGSQSKVISYKNLSNLYHITFMNYKDLNDENTLDYLSCYFNVNIHKAWMYEIKDKLIIPLPFNITVEELENKIDDLSIEENIVIKKENFEYLKYNDDGTFRTGSIIRYVGEDADEWPFDLQVIIFGDIVGGEDTIGDGKVDILDVVKLRYCIINNECEEMKANNYPMFFASDLSYDDIVDIVDVVTLRNMIVG